MKRILIVDDSKTARMMIKRCLEIAGFGDTIFIEASNGEEALITLRRNPADLILTDLNMPVMDGETLLKWLKGSPKTHDIPVIMISSTGNPGRKQRVMEMGAYAVLGKPITPELLKESLTEFLPKQTHWGL